MIDHPPRVSVIIPTFNRSHFLPQAIHSVLAQTYPDFEVLVVDDGSSDNTAAVVGRIDDPRIVYIYQENAGRSTARNRGLAQARGDYIAFLDDDDLYISTRLANHVLFLEVRPSLDAVVSGTQVINENGEVQAILKPWREQPELTLRGCLYACPIPTCSVLLRRRVLDSIPYWFDPEMDLAEDIDLFIRLMYAGMQITWLPDVLSVRRLHPGTSQRDGAGYERGYIRMLDKVFARSDIPEDLSKDRHAIYTHYHFVGACHAYAAKQVAEAKQSMRHALCLGSDVFLEHTLSDAVDHIVSFASTFRVTDSAAYINFVFDNFPDLSMTIHKYRRWALGAFYMGRVFRACKDDENPSAKDWALGIFYTPHWIRNRGVWSILVKQIIGVQQID